MAKQSLQILLVEDDEIDAEYLIRGFQRQGFESSITVAGNGLEALHYLRCQTQQDQLTHSRIIITDINMPLMNGIELLQTLRGDPALRRSVVFVLSSSDLEADKIAAYQYQAAGYLLKADLDRKLPQFFRLLESYQLMVKFPPI